MGIMGYYQRFIEGFSKLAYPITSIHEKGAVKFEWTIECQEIFNKLIHLLIVAPIWKLAN